MSEKTRQTLQMGATIVSVLLAVLGSIGAFYVLPYRMTAAEGAIKKMQEERTSDHELLSRIDERTAAIQRDLNRLAR